MELALNWRHSQGWGNGVPTDEQILESLDACGIRLLEPQQLSPPLTGLLAYGQLTVAANLDTEHWRWCLLVATAASLYGLPAFTLRAPPVPALALTQERKRIVMTAAALAFGEGPLLNPLWWSGSKLAAYARIPDISANRTWLYLREWLAQRDAWLLTQQPGLAEAIGERQSVWAAVYRSQHARPPSGRRPDA